MNGAPKMSKLANVFVTLALVTISYGLAFFLSSLGDALTIVGSTTNPIIGFIIPIMFYWKINSDKSIWSKEKFVSLVVGILIIAISLLDLANFFLYKDE